MNTVNDFEGNNFHEIFHPTNNHDTFCCGIRSCISTYRARISINQIAVEVQPYFLIFFLLCVMVVVDLTMTRLGEDVNEVLGITTVVGIGAKSELLLGG